MDGFQAIKCPGCQRVAPFDVGGISARLIIRYRCKRCKRLIHVTEGFTPHIVEETRPPQQARVPR
jgi:hypothetical protein